MDRMLYISGAAATQTLDQQASIANNVANISTTGFRAQLNAYRAVPVQGQEAPTRAFSMAVTEGADMRHGTVSVTGRKLDIAINGDGWIAIQGNDGTESYTRGGSLQLSADGRLVTALGQQVLGEAGPIIVPPGSALSIGNDGSITTQGPGDPLTGLNQAGRIKLVNPDPNTLKRGEDATFRTADGEPAQADPNVTLQTGALEGSNVNPVGAMVDMIANARSYEFSMKNIQTANENDQKANQLLSMS